MIKNAFYFVLKALLVLKIFKLLSWLLGHVEKKASKSAVAQTSMTVNESIKFVSSINKQE